MKEAQLQEATNGRTSAHRPIEKETASLLYSLFSCPCLNIWGAVFSYERAIVSRVSSTCPGCNMYNDL